MRRLYVRTDDFRLAHRLLTELQERNLPAKQVSIGDTIEPDAYWFGTSEEVAELGGCGVAVDPDAVSEAISTWLLARQVHSPPRCWWLASTRASSRLRLCFEGVLMGKREMESIDQALDEIVKPRRTPAARAGVGPNRSWLTRSPRPSLESCPLAWVPRRNCQRAPNQRRPTTARARFCGG